MCQIKPIKSRVAHMCHGHYATIGSRRWRQEMRRVMRTRVAEDVGAAVRLALELHFLYTPTLYVWILCVICVCKCVLVGVSMWCVCVVCVCVCMGGWVCFTWCVCAWLCVWESERECVCACMCVESVCARTFVCRYVCLRVCTCVLHACACLQI